MAVVLKTTVSGDRHRGFESHALRCVMPQDIKIKRLFVVSVAIATETTNSSNNDLRGLVLAALLTHKAPKLTGRRRLVAIAGSRCVAASRMKPVDVTGATGRRRNAIPMSRPPL